MVQILALLFTAAPSVTLHKIFLYPTLDVFMGGAIPLTTSPQVQTATQIAVYLNLIKLSCHTHKYHWRLNRYSLKYCNPVTLRKELLL